MKVVSIQHPNFQRGVKLKTIAGVANEFLPSRPRLKALDVRSEMSVIMKVHNLHLQLSIPLLLLDIADNVLESTHLRGCEMARNLSRWMPASVHTIRGLVRCTRNPWTRHIYHNVSAVKRSIGSTTGFHNHREGPY